MAKKITIESLVSMVQRGFEETAKKNELGVVRDEVRAVRKELLETRELLAQAIKDLELRFVATTSHNREEVDRLRSWMEGIEERVSELERGGRRRRAA